MEKLVFDSGIKEYQINQNGILRFNPGDPNVYARFMESAEKIKSIEQEMVAKANAVDRSSDTAGEEVLRIMRETDLKMKEVLNGIFGHENNFDEIMEGVNLMAVAANGERVITNLLSVLRPIMESGAKACVSQEVAVAKQNRELRRAAKK